MNQRSRVDVFLAVVGFLICAVFLPKLFLRDSALYTEVLTETVLRWVGALPKLASLVIAALCAVRISGSFAMGTAMRLGWSLVACWFSMWSLGQGVLVVYSLILHTSPFPSPADGFFMIGYPAMLGAFLVVIRGYTSTGLLGSARSHLITALAAGVPFLLLGIAVLRPVIASDGAPLEVAINVGYPAFDIAALVPTVVLARMALRMSGGALFWVWGLMALGIAFMVAGDLLYGWFSVLEYTALDPLLDVTFVAGYALAARAVYQQYRISVVVPAGAP